MESQRSVGPRVLDGANFPSFVDGDVRIVISGSRQYQLHRTILRNGSPLFRQLLSDNNTASLANKAKKKGVVVTNMLRAHKCDVEDQNSPSLILKPVILDNEGRAPADEARVPLDLENGVSVPPEFIAYDKVLGAFYHHAIDLSDFGGRNMRDMIFSINEVLKVAEYLQCVPIITQHFESTLLAKGQRLFAHIGRHPAIWLKIAIRMQSKTLYKESIIHAAGQYRTEGVQLMMQDLNHSTRHLIIDLVKDIAEEVKRNVTLMLSYYPTELMRRPALTLVDQYMNSRNSYSNDILHWIALSAFRHWLSIEVASDKTHHAQDLGFAFMKSIKAGEDEYLDQQALDSFHEHFPMSSRGKNIVQGKIDDIKRHVMQWAHMVAINNTRLDVESVGHRYFTCARFEGDEGYPWEVTQNDIESDALMQDSDDEEANGSAQQENDAGDGESAAQGGNAEEKTAPQDSAANGDDEMSDNRTLAGRDAVNHLMRSFPEQQTLTPVAFASVPVTSPTPLPRTSWKRMLQQLARVRDDVLKMVCLATCLRPAQPEEDQERGPMEEELTSRLAEEGRPSPRATPAPYRVTRTPPPSPAIPAISTLSSGQTLLRLPVLQPIPPALLEPVEGEGFRPPPNAFDTLAGRGPTPVFMPFPVPPPAPTDPAARTQPSRFQAGVLDLQSDYSRPTIEIPVGETSTRAYAATLSGGGDNDELSYYETEPSPTPSEAQFERTERLRQQTDDTEQLVMQQLEAGNGTPLITLKVEVDRHLNLGRLLDY